MMLEYQCGANGKSCCNSRAAFARMKPVRRCSGVTSVIRKKFQKQGRANGAIESPSNYTALNSLPAFRAEDR
jgi:hypothetical protein